VRGYCASPYARRAKPRGGQKRPSTGLDGTLNMRAFRSFPRIWSPPPPHPRVGASRLI